MKVNKSMAKKKQLQTRLKHFLNTQEDSLEYEEEQETRELTLIQREEDIDNFDQNQKSEEVIFEQHKIDELKKNRKRDMDKLSSVKAELDSRGEEQSNLVSRLDFEKGKNLAIKEKIKEIQKTLQELDREYDLQERELISLKENNGTQEIEYKQLVFDKEERLKEIENARSKNKSILNKISKKSVEKNELESLFASHVQLMQNLKEETHQNSLKVESLDTVLKEAKIQIDQQINSIKKSEVRLQELQTHITTKEAELNSKKHEITDKEKKLSELNIRERSLADNSEELNRQKKILNENLTILNKRMLEDLHHNEELKEIINKLENTISLKKERVEEQEHKLSNLEESSRNLSLKVSNLRKELHNKEQILDQLQSNSKSILVSKQDNEDEYTKLKKKTREVESELRVKNEEFLNQEKVLSEVLFNKTHKQKQYNQLEHQVKEFDLKLESVIRDIDATSKINETLVASLKEVEDIIVNRESEVKAKQQEIITLTESVKHRRFSLGRLTHKLEGLEKELSSSKDQIITKKFEAQHLVKERREVISELKNTTDVISILKLQKNVLSSSIQKLDTSNKSNNNKLIKLNDNYKTLITENTQLDIDYDKSLKTYDQLNLQLIENEKTNKVLRLSIKRIKKSLADTDKKISKHQTHFTNLVSKQEILQKEYDSIILKSRDAAVEWSEVQESFENVSKLLIITEEKLRKEEDALLGLYEERNQLKAQCQTRELLIQKRKEETVKAESERAKLQAEIKKGKESLEYLQNEAILGKLNYTKLQDTMVNKKAELLELKAQYEQSHALYLDQKQDLEQQEKVITQMEVARTRYIELITDLVNKNDSVQKKLKSNNELMNQFHKDIQLIKSYQKKFSI
jgi:chromosome segregation ATPase